MKTIVARVCNEFWRNVKVHVEKFGYRSASDFYIEAIAEKLTNDKKKRAAEKVAMLENDYEDFKNKILAEAAND